MLMWQILSVQLTEDMFPVGDRRNLADKLPSVLGGIKEAAVDSFMHSTICTVLSL